MTLQYVRLTLNVYDGQGNLAVAGTATLTPSSQLVDPVDGQVITPYVPVVPFRPGTAPPVVKLLATDSTNVGPAGWNWTISFSNVPGDLSGGSFFLPYSAGASQSYSALAIVPGAVPVALSNADGGTAATGSVPAALQPGSMTGGGASELPPFIPAIMTTAGDLVTGGAYGAAERLPGNPAATREFLVSQGTGTQAQVPEWSGIGLGDLPLYNPLAYGAAGNGTTDDTLALQACLAASVSAAGATPAGITDLAGLTYLTSSPLTISAGMHIRNGTIVNTASSVFEFAASSYYNTFDDLRITASGGHIWDCSSGPSLSFIRITGVNAIQQNASYGIWHQAGGAFDDCLVGDNCYLQGPAGASVSPWSVTGIAGNVNSVAFRRMRCLGSNAPVPFFAIDPGSAHGWNEEIRFDHITFEECSYGAIWMTACVDAEISMCSFWDATPEASVYSFTKSAGGYPCRNITVRGGRSSGASGSVYDLYCDSFTTNILVENFGTWGTAPNISTPALATTLINPTTAAGNSSVTTPVLAASGLTGAVTPTRYIGGTSGGPPSGGTYEVGDWAPDNTGIIWVYTSAGWEGIGAAVSYVPCSADWVTTPGNFTWTMPANAQVVDVILCGGGGGGGSGALVSSGPAGGGGAGSGGSVSTHTFLAADLASSCGGYVGAGGAGGAAVSGGAASGNAGAAGIVSYFQAQTGTGNTVRANGGSAGSGGTASGGGGGGAASAGMFSGSTGAGGGTGAAGSTAGTGAGATGGGGGGGISSAPAAFGGGATSYSYMGDSANTGAGGVAGGAAPTAGTQPVVRGIPSCGGGGGASAVTGNAQAGASAYYGGGGGGGGAALTGGSSGAGGSGGPGFALIITRFA